MFQYFDLLLGFLGALFAAYQGYVQYLDEKQFNYYKEAIKKLFSPDKEEVMASIATLGVYTHRRKYKKSTIDTLINILYTELDYDVSNAIIGVLIQSGKKKEIEYIASRVIEINRNFFIQTHPLNQREKDLKDRIKELEKLKNPEPQSGEKPNDKENPKLNLENDIKNLEDNNKYKLKWHKLVTADVLAMILNKASKAGLTTGLDLEFYQNDFNYCSLAGFTIDNFSIKHTAISSGNIMDLKFKNMKEIYSSTFANSLISDCVFSGGTIDGNSFCDCDLENVVFENLTIVNSYFIGVKFVNCRFNNVKGLRPEYFFDSEIDKDTKFNSSFDSSQVHNLTSEQVRNLINSTPIADYRKEEILEYIPK